MKISNVALVILASMMIIGLGIAFIAMLCNFIAWIIGMSTIHWIAIPIGIILLLWCICTQLAGQK